MAKIPNLKLSIDEVSQTIDLKELFGVSLSSNEALKQEIGQAIIDKIIERTKNGKSVNGNNLKSPYSKSYSESDEFKAFGKSKNDINMTLTGQMLGTLDIINSGKNKIKIGWSDSEENAKAYNHNIGDTVPKRPFFGLNMTELEEIRSKYQDKVDESISGNQDEINQIRAEIIKRLSSNIFEVENG